MIKSYENFVNEGFLHNVISGIDAGIGAFKADRGAEKAAEDEMKKALNGNTEYSDEAKMTILVKQLVERSAWLADGFSWEKLTDDDGNGSDVMLYRIERLEEILSEMKNLMPK